MCEEVATDDLADVAEIAARVQAIDTTGDGVADSCVVIPIQQQQQAALFTQHLPGMVTPTTAMASPVVQATAGGADDGLAGEIRKLHDLHEQGILTDVEFAAAKAKVIAPGTKALQAP